MSVSMIFYIDLNWFKLIKETRAVQLKEELLPDRCDRYIDLKCRRRFTRYGVVSFVFSY